RRRKRTIVEGVFDPRPFSRLDAGRAVGLVPLTGYWTSHLARVLATLSENKTRGEFGDQEDDSDREDAQERQDHPVATRKFRFGRIGGYQRARGGGGHG